MSILSKCFRDGSYALVRSLDRVEELTASTTSVEMIPCTPYLLKVAAGEIYLPDTDEISPFTEDCAGYIAQMVFKKGLHEDGFDILASRLHQIFNGIKGEDEGVHYRDEPLFFNGMTIELYDLGWKVFQENIVENGRLLPPPSNH